MQSLINWALALHACAHAKSGQIDDVHEIEIRSRSTTTTAARIDPSKDVQVEFRS